MTKNAPPIAISSSGNSFATVAIELSRTPSVTPRRLTSDQNTNAADQDGGRRMAGPDSAGTSWPMLAANTVDTAAVANVPSIHSSTPERKPAYGPNAVPTYAYGPPVSDDAAAGVGDAQHDQPHRDRAHQVGDRRRGAERAGDVRRQPEDAAADRDVDDAGGQTERADRADQRIPSRRICIRAIVC